MLCIDDKSRSYIKERAMIVYMVQRTETMGLAILF